MSELPRGFQFSQSALQDYVVCARRFELRYIKRLKWPSVQAEPLLEHERHMILGERFHRLVQQYWAGVPQEILERMLQDATLSAWWQRFKMSGVKWGEGTRRYVEFELLTHLNGVSLLAKMDLLTLGEDGVFTIVDWKTSPKPTPRKVLENRLQTRIYPFVLTQAGHSLIGAPIDPQQVRMVYWFTDAPNTPQVFTYDAHQLAADRALLTQLITNIVQQRVFPLTEDVRQCAFCRYRSLCNRGVVAGDFRDEAFLMDDEYEFAQNIDFDQIGEVAF